MSKKVTVSNLEGFIVGKERVEKKEATEFNGKKYEARPERYLLYILIGNRDKDGLFETEPRCCKIGVTKAGFDKVKTSVTVRCNCDFEYDKITVVSIEGYTLDEFN